MSRPLIGITTYAQDVRFGVGELYAAALPMSYAHAVNVAGGRAVLIPPDDAGADLIDRLDGLVLSGGADVDPAAYGEDPHPTTVFRPDRDQAELILLRAALAADLPVLGVCRGFQLLVAVYGGRLHQHLPDALGHSRHRPDSGYGSHEVKTTPGSLAETVLGPAVSVNSFHHQGVADPGELTVSGWADDDLPEVVEDPAKRFVLGVQWHPEDLTDQRVFSALVSSA